MQSKQLISNSVSLYAMFFQKKQKRILDITNPNTLSLSSQ